MLFRRIFVVIAFALCGAAAVAVGAEEYPLHKAAAAGDVAKIKQLVAGGADINLRDDENFTPLERAVDAGHIPAIKQIVGAGADINYADKDGYTALHIAMDSKRISVLTILAKAGADVNAPLTYVINSNDDDVPQSPIARFALALAVGAFPLTLNITPVHIALMDDFGLSELVKYGADVNVDMISGVGMTPIFMAAAFDKTAAIPVLVRAGADINKQSRLWGTALHVAAQEGQPETAFALVKSGADVNIRNLLGKTAADVAEDARGENDVIAIFLRKAAERNKEDAHKEAEEMLRKLDE